MIRRPLLTALWGIVVAVAALGCLGFALYWSFKGDYARATWNFVLAAFVLQQKRAA